MQKSNARLCFSLAHALIEEELSFFFGILRPPQFRQKAMKNDCVIVLSTEPVIKSWTGRNESAINYQASALHTPIR